MLLWCCRYLKINKYLRFWFSSARDPSRRYISMVIYAPAPMHHWSLSRRAGSTIGTTGGARAAQEFVGCSGAVPTQATLQSCLTAAPANMGKSTAPCAGGCNVMKGLTIMSCPTQTEKYAWGCGLQITRRHFSFDQQEVEISLYWHRASWNSP